MIGYALARLRFPGSNFLGVGIFLAYLVPPTLLFLPLAQVIAFDDGLGAAELGALAVGRQRDVRASLIASFSIPQGFAVADQQDVHAEDFTRM